MTRVPLAAVGVSPIASVDEFGYLHFADGSRVEWWVLGDDGWHVPRVAPSRRQRSVDNTPVIETTIRVPGGDVSWRAAAVAVDTSQRIVVECENRGTIPVALAVAHVAADGYVTADITPVTHGTTWRRSLDGDADVPALDTVAKGWAALARQGARVMTEDPNLDDLLLAARCALLLHAGDLITKGKRADKDAAGLVANALTLLDYEDEAGALRRSARLKPQRKGLPLVPVGRAPSGVDALEVLADPRRAAATVIAIRELVAHDDNGSVDVLPGFDEAWRGRSIEVDNLPTNHGAVSFAVRWHGDKPALLWESPVSLTARALSDSWSTDARSGEELIV